MSRATRWNLLRYRRPIAFDETQLLNRMETEADDSPQTTPRHIGSGGVRLSIRIQPIDLPAFAGQRWGSPFRTSLRE